MIGLARCRRHSHRLALLALLIAPFASTAASFEPNPLQAPAELRDVQSKTEDGVTVSVSILTDEQAKQHFGVDIGRRELQALWLSVRNTTDRRLWFIRTVLDPDYYSADEAALLVQKGVPAQDREKLRQLFRDESIRSRLEPRTMTQGFVFLPRIEGGRYVDVRLQRDAYLATDPPPTDADRLRPERRELRFDFALPLPDGDFDYERLDANRTYGGQPLPDLTTAQLRSSLEQLPCCAADDEGQAGGDPLNVVLVGNSDEVLSALTRSGWSFTHRISVKSVRREVGAVVSGSPYAVAPVSSLFVFGRKQDVALQRARRSIAQRNHMRLWLAPYRFEGRSVWVGQISRDIGVKVTPKSPTLTTHVIDPEVDTTREYLLHSLVARGFVDRFGFVKGSAAATLAEPRYNLTGDAYHSDGMRLVVVLTLEPVPPDRIRSLAWEQSAAPVAEGQSESAQRNVRPLEEPADIEP